MSKSRSPALFKRSSSLDSAQHAHCEPWGGFLPSQQAMGSSYSFGMGLGFVCKCRLFLRVKKKKSNSK